MRNRTLVAGMVRRDLYELRSYAFNTFTQVAVIFIIFLFIFFGAKTFIGDRASSGNTLSAIVVGFMMWTLAISTYGDIAFNVVGEATAGTLEQLAMSPYGLAVVMLAKFVSSFIMGLLMIFVLLVLMMVSTGRWLHLDVPSLLPLFVLTAVGVQGVGMMIGGLALVFKRVQSLLQILQFAFIALVSISPHAVPALKYLPIAWGNHLTVHVMIDGDPISRLGPQVAFLAAHSALWLAAGVAVFRRLMNVVRDRALLGQY